VHVIAIAVKGYLNGVCALLKYISRLMQSRELNSVLTCRPTQTGSIATRGEKRVSNAKLKNALGVHLAFPSYREGLSAIHAGDIRPYD
jgi:hypothetical protein